MTTEFRRPANPTGNYYPYISEQMCIEPGKHVVESALIDREVPENEAEGIARGLEVAFMMADGDVSLVKSLFEQGEPIIRKGKVIEQHPIYDSTVYKAVFGENGTI